MNETVITAVASVASAFLAAWYGYKQGKKKSDADATNTAFEGYNLALENLKKNFTEQIAELKQQIADLKRENTELKNTISKMTQK
jgi:TolA-binding protein